MTPLKTHFCLVVVEALPKTALYGLGEEVLEVRRLERAQVELQVACLVQ